MIYLRKEVDQKKQDIKNKLRESVSKDRRYLLKAGSKSEKQEMIQTVKNEQSLRKEIGSAMYKLG